MKGFHKVGEKKIRGHIVTIQTTKKYFLNDSFIECNLY